jgi:PAS domain S-box-containing protein
MEAAPRERHDQALVTDRDGVIRHWESACVSVFGYSREEAVGQSLDLIVPPPSRRSTGAASTGPWPPVS